VVPVKKFKSAWKSVYGRTTEDPSLARLSVQNDASIGAYKDVFRPQMGPLRKTDDKREAQVATWNIIWNSETLSSVFSLSSALSVSQLANGSRTTDAQPRRQPYRRHPRRNDH